MTTATAQIGSAALARTGPDERDTRGMAVSSRLDERALGRTRHRFDEREVIGNVLAHGAHEQPFVAIDRNELGRRHLAEVSAQPGITLELQRVGHLVQHDPEPQPVYRHPEPSRRRDYVPVEEEDLAGLPGPPWL